MDQPISFTESFFRSFAPDDMHRPTGNDELTEVQTSGAGTMLLYAVAIYIARSLYETFIANVLANRMGVRDTRKSPDYVPQLEVVYRAGQRTPNEADIKQLSGDSGMSTRSVDVWFRRRRNWDRPSKLTKFKETSWRFVFYSGVFMYGILTLVRTPWFWDLRHCWLGYPVQTHYPSVHYYYMLEGGFYISLLLTLFKDNKRKDFTEQILHHFATVFLIVFSYSAGFVRVGSLIMAVHDVSDIFLELAKCSLYANRRKLADNLFVVFATTFLFTRLYVYPFYLMRTVLVDCRLILAPFTGWYVFVTLLSVLQILHIFWAWTILRMAAKKVNNDGAVEKDDRSDVEELTGGDDHED